MNLDAFVFTACRMYSGGLQQLQLAHAGPARLVLHGNAGY